MAPSDWDFPYCVNINETVLDGDLMAYCTYTDNFKNAKKVTTLKV